MSKTWHSGRPCKIASVSSWRAPSFTEQVLLYGTTEHPRRIGAFPVPILASAGFLNLNLPLAVLPHLFFIPFPLFFCRFLFWMYSPDPSRLLYQLYCTPLVFILCDLCRIQHCHLQLTTVCLPVTHPSHLTEELRDRVPPSPRTFMVLSFLLLYSLHQKTLLFLLYLANYF